MMRAGHARWRTGQTALLTLVLGSLFLAVLGLHVRYNVSPSAPRGWYWRTRVPPTAPLGVGQLVVLTPPAWVQQELHRIATPHNPALPWLKTIVAGPGDTVCLEGEAVRINGVVRGARPLLHDYPLPPRLGCTRLAPDTYFVMNPHPRSFDSRYVGAVPRAAMRGTMVPLYTWEER